MKKIFCAVLMMFVMCPMSLGASEDMSVYVRQDVFDAKMETLLTRIEGKIDALSERIDGVDKKIDGVERRISYGSIIGDIVKYLPFVIISAIILMAYAAIFFESRTKSRTNFATVEDVRRIANEMIAENNAKIRA